MCYIKYIDFENVGSFYGEVVCVIVDLKVIEVIVIESGECWLCVEM